MVVDDHSGCRRVVREVVNCTDGFEAVGEASSGEEAIGLAEALRPDLVLMDVRMPGIDGWEAARRISSEHPAATIVLISSQSPAEIATPSACGAATLLSKDELCPASLAELWRTHGRGLRISG